ncbi:hypothetical protein [Mesorhizobium sp. WSM3860]|uniref:hypothetical protein n=1 Tax=Mesorhizobium sp. WSM3860 TaxID=2029403 RepID=UPI001140BE30|nr:hypothetical protein [Mesorhizobium sp. WSM3860]
MRLIITDVTEMSTGNYCVAGWRAHTQQMVRPLPGGANWTLARLQQHGVVPGATIQFLPTGQVHPGARPHSTEDTPVDANAIQLVDAGPINWIGGDSPAIFGTVAAAFDNHVANNNQWNGVFQGVYVPAGAETRSLGAIQIDRNAIELVESFEKLKAVVDDGHREYQLAVSSKVLKEAWRQGGINAARQALPGAARFHVRLGLARPFGNPADKCYMMVNGVHG